jgi:leucyl aminopeptidase
MSNQIQTENSQHQASKQITFLGCQQIQKKTYRGGQNKAETANYAKNLSSNINHQYIPDRLLRNEQNEQGSLENDVPRQTVSS